MSQYRTPQFSETEQTPGQRWESVAWALGAGSTDGGGPSPELVRLYKFYVAGDIDLAMLGGELDRLYPQYPSGDPQYPDPPHARFCHLWCWSRNRAGCFPSQPNWRHWCKN